MGLLDVIYGRTDAPRRPEDEQKDQLGIEPYYEGLTEFVRHCQTPMTIGLQGEWGSGKTSLMNYVKSTLECADEEGTTKTYWFETWQYGAVGGSDSLGMLLLRDLSNRLLEELKDASVRLRYSSNLKGAFSAAIPAMAGLATTAMTRSDRAGEAASAAAGTLTGARREDMRVCFKELVDEALGTGDGDRRLVVFIDDLDRVPPKLAVRLLEVLKNFMDVPRCVFVVACDYEVVREGVADLMGISATELGRKSEKVDAFFHKLFQVQFHMPVGAYSIDTLLKDYLSSCLIKHNEHLKGLTTKARNEKIETFLHTGSVRGGEKDVAAGDWYDLLREVVQAAIGTNPRAFKRYLNLLDLTCCVDSAFRKTRKKGEDGPLAHWALGSPEKDAATLRWCTALLPIVAMQQRWPDIAGPLLIDAKARTRKGGDQPDAAFTDFERRLRTLTGQWPTTADDQDSDVVRTHFEDETFVESIQQVFGTTVEEGANNGLLADLVRFGGHWFSLLDNNARGDESVLDDEELFVIGKWSERLGKMGTTKVQLSGIANLRRLGMDIDMNAGDGLAGLALHLLGLPKKLGFEHVKGRPGGDGAWWWVRVKSRNRDMLTIKPKDGVLYIKFNATRHNEVERWGLPGLGAAGERLARAILAASKKRPDEDDESDPDAGVPIESLCEQAPDLRMMKSGYEFDFGQRHRFDRNTVLKEAFTDYLDEVDRLERTRLLRENAELGGSSEQAKGPSSEGPQLGHPVD